MCRYLSPPWLKCGLESQELLALCLKKIKGLNRVKLINAGFVWTESHSKRIKLKITIQKEVQANAILQSTFIVELVVESIQCDDCKKTWTPHTWNSVVQIRQKVDHKRSIFYLEQIILRHSMHSKAINVKEMPDGLDFFFANKMNALMLYDFVHSQVVSKCRQSKQLISADISSNDYCYKHSYFIELAPICHEDLVYIPPKMRKEVGGCSPVGLVTKVATLIQILDPINQKCYTLDEDSYWSHSFKPICTRRNLSEFIVINIEPQDSRADRTGTSMSRVDEAKNYCYADVELQRIADFGENDTRFFAKTHLGNVLKIDNHVLGYELSSLNVPEVEGMKGTLPDIIIVKKKYLQKRSHKKRIWRLKQIDKEEPMEEDRRAKKMEEHNVSLLITLSRVGKGLRGVPGRDRREPRAAFEDQPLQGTHSDSSLPSIGRGSDSGADQGHGENGGRRDQETCGHRACAEGGEQGQACRQVPAEGQASQARPQG